MTEFEIQTCSIEIVVSLSWSISSQCTIGCSLVLFSQSQLSVKWIIDRDCKDEVAFQIYASVDINTKPYRQIDGPCRHKPTSTLLLLIAPE